MASSQHSLACYYLRGDILEKDNEKGFELCLKAAEQGYGLAMRDVGRCYQFGNGVMGNMKKAAEWYEKALEVIDDLELEHKTAMFKMMGENDENWGEDYPGDDDDGIPDEIVSALRTFDDAVEYEIELSNEGVLPEAPIPDESEIGFDMEDFPRISLMAEKGDERAIDILDKIKELI